MARQHGPRHRNYNIPGHAHELTFSCYRRYKFLESDRTRQWLADAISAACKNHQYLLWGYVFMPEHAHVIVFPTQSEYDIAAFRKDVKEPVGRKAIQFLENESPEWLAKITRKRGKKVERLFWQSGGGYDRNIDQPKTLGAMIDYVHRNPIRRGLVKSSHEWKWSSAAWYAGLGEGPLKIDPTHDAWSVG